MRRIGKLSLIIGATLALAIACDDDDDGDEDASVEVDAGPGDDEDAGADDEDAGADGEDAGPGDAGTDAGGGGGAAPVIMEVSWEAAEGCTNFTASDVDITVTVSDSDTPAGMLTFSGSAAGCTGAIDAATSTINCPNAAPYPSSVTVTDPEGNSDTASFTFGQCDTGSTTF